MKFLPGRSVMAPGTADFASAEGAERSPVAQRLFQVEGVSVVFLGSDFVTVAKAETKTWQVLKPAILGIIVEHFAANRPVILESTVAPAAQAGDDSQIVAQIKELLRTRVGPAGARHVDDHVFQG